jgi:hypothetical protein
MNNPERKLNDKQVHILLLTFKFRYLTTDNLAKLRSISHNSAYSALNKLTERGYLGRKHNKSYRLQNKSARYYLTPKAVIFLQDPKFKLDTEILATRRHEDKKSTSFVDHQVAIVDTFIDIRLNTQYEIHRILTASDIPKDDRESYPKPLPNLEVLYETSEDGVFNRTLVDIFPDDQHLFIAKKRIRQYIQHYEDREWEWDEYPSVVIIRRSKANIKNLNKYIEEKMEDMYLDEDDFSMIADTSAIDK